MLPNERNLLDVLQAAADCSGGEYRRFVLGWLDRQVGFDGAVWGHGQRLADGSIRIDGAQLSGRPESLLAGYGAVAALDPVGRRFGEDPQSLQTVSVERDYAAADLRPVGEYLEQYRVRHLMLCGAATRQGGLSWITLYREDRGRPFGADAAALAGFAVPFALLAERDKAAPEPAATCGELSRREREVAAAYAAGEGYKAIARNLGLSPATVRSHLLAIFRKLGVHNKIELRRRLELS